MPRKKLTRDQREAACLLQIKRGDGSWLIPEPLRSTGSAKQILAGVQYDHGTPHAWTRDDRPQNLTPMAKADHAVKTAKIDVPRIAKSKRVAAAHATHVAAVAVKTGGEAEPLPRQRQRSQIPSRGFLRPDGIRYDWSKGRYTSDQASQKRVGDEEPGAGGGQARDRAHTLLPRRLGRTRKQASRRSEDDGG